MLPHRSVSGALQVAVANNGEVFVSDGYCNARVAHFASDGTHLGDFTLAGGPMNVPHSLVLDECEGALMVADREAAQVHRFELASRKHTGGCPCPAITHSGIAHLSLLTCHHMGTLDCHESFGDQLPTAEASPRKGLSCMHDDPKWPQNRLFQ